MNLEDALGGSNSGSGWPGGQPTNNPSWPGGPSSGGGAWPSGGGGSGGGAWPSGGGGSGGGAWPSGGGGGGGAWATGPGPQPGGGSSGGGAWPAGGGGGGGAWPAGPGPGPQPGGGSSGGGAWPAGPGPQPGPQPGGHGGGWSGPSPAPGPSIPSAPQISPKVPYTQKLPNGVYNKLLITIVGTVKHNAKMFTLDMSSGHDIAFHLNPRFNENGKKVIVRNSVIGKKWGKEERELSHFPFVPGQQFEMKILCTGNEFKVAVNKAHLLEFKHRFHDLRSISHLGIYNDVDLSSVNFENLP